MGLGQPGGQAGGGVPAVLKVSQQHIWLSSGCLQLPSCHGVAPPQEARERGGGKSTGLKWGGSSYEGRRRAGHLPDSAGQLGRGCGRGSLSLGHEGVGAALVGAVGLALGWQQLLGVREGYACYQPQWPQAAQLGMGSGTMRHKADRGVPCSPNLSRLPGQTPRLGFGRVF